MTGILDRQTSQPEKDRRRMEKRSGKELPPEPNEAQERLDRESRVEPGAPANGDNVYVELEKQQDEETPNEKRQGTASTSQGGL